MEKKTQAKPEAQIVQTDWLLQTALLYAKSSFIWNIVWWLVILIAALQMSGLSIGTITDKWFWIKEIQIQQEYEINKLQLSWLQSFNEKINSLEAKQTKLDERISKAEEWIRRIYKQLKKWINIYFPNSN